MTHFCSKLAAMGKGELCERERAVPTYLDTYLPRYKDGEV